ncbi:MAG: fructosamine kinase family protein [Kiloniellales bacterium]
MSAAGPAPLADPAVRAAIAETCGSEPTSAVRLHGGCLAEVYRVTLADGAALVAKVQPLGDAFDLSLEGFMLRYLAEHSSLPVPRVLRSSRDLLLMELVEHGGRVGGSAERHLAELLAALHGITGPGFGFERDTVIGPLRQANDWSPDWPGFFGARRLLPLGRLLRDAGKLSDRAARDLERMTARLPDLIPSGASPSLIHGDLWSGNVLVKDGRIAACLDPAIYFADPEIELAFGTLFGPLGRDFFARYHELRPIPPDFFEERRDLYNLYPLMVHALLFGGSYIGEVTARLRRFA